MFRSMHLPLVIVINVTVVITKSREMYKVTGRCNKINVLFEKFRRTQMREKTMVAHFFFFFFLVAPINRRLIND